MASPLGLPHSDYGGERVLLMLAGEHESPVG